MSLTKALVDTNVCLDVALIREPFVVHSAKVLDLSERGVFEGYVAADSFDTLFYLMNQIER